MKKFSVERSRVLLYNRYVLIFIFILALVNVIQLATIGDYFTVSLFVLVGFLTTYFSKNMIVVLTVAMVFANMVKYGTDLANPWVYEGFDNKKKEPMTKKDKTSKIEEMVAENKKKQENLENGKDADADADADDDDEDTEEEFSGKKSKKQQKIEKDALDDLRHEMKLGFKRLNQNIDSVGMSNLFS